MTRLRAGWLGFWFAPQPTSTLALVRIAVGLLCLAWGLALAPDLMDLYSRDGVVVAQPGGQGAGTWGLLGVVEGDGALVALYAALLVGSMALALGAWTRVAALVVFVAMVSLARRNPYVLNDGDALLRLTVLYLALAPAGASLSLDRLRRTRQRFWEFPARAPWALRLIQLQLCAVYLSTVVQRLHGSSWTDGTGVSYVLRLEDLQRLPVPAALVESPKLMAAATFTTLAIELAIPLLVWSARTRAPVLAAGLLVHLSIELTLRVGFFSFAVLACYLAFVPSAAAAAWVTAARDRFAGRGPISAPPDRSGAPVGDARPLCCRRAGIREVPWLSPRPPAPARPIGGAGHVPQLTVPELYVRRSPPSCARPKRRPSEAARPMPFRFASRRDLERALAPAGAAPDP